jgi:hypothetical protein
MGHDAVGEALLEVLEPRAATRRSYLAASSA